MIVKSLAASQTSQLAQMRATKLDGDDHPKPCLCLSISPNHLHYSDPNQQLSLILLHHLKVEVRLVLCGDE